MHTHIIIHTLTHSTQEGTVKTSAGTSSLAIKVEMNWEQIGDTATREAGHSVLMLLYNQMGKQGWTDRRGEQIGQRHLGKDALGQNPGVLAYSAVLL
jgi:hypothetical protein